MRDNTIKISTNLSKVTYMKLKKLLIITYLIYIQMEIKADVVDIKTKVHQERMNHTEQMELEEFLKNFE